MDDKTISRLASELVKLRRSDVSDEMFQIGLEAVIRGARRGEINPLTTLAEIRESMVKCEEMLAPIRAQMLA